MDFDEEPTSPTEQAEESYLFNEEGNEIAEDVEADADADGDEDGEGGHSDDGSDDQSSASDEDADGDATDGSENDDEDDDDAMDVDVTIVGRPDTELDKGRNTRSVRLNGSDARLDPKDPLPPSLKRQRLFFPPPPNPSPRSINLSPLISIPIASPVHALAASLCLSHVLTGSQDGYVRDWDTYASANGGREGRPVLGREGIRSGVSRGWWSGMESDQGKREPVWSLACQRDGLWGLSGMGNGNINLFTVRHAVGKTHHVLSGGHKGAVSALALGESEDILYSAGWDGALVEWDLHTGQPIRTFPTQPSQISSVSLQPSSSGPSASPSTDYNIYIRETPLPPPSSTNTTIITSEPNGDITRASSVDPTDPLAVPTTTNGITENGHAPTNGTDSASVLASRRPSEMDAEGEVEDDLTSADADGEREELDSTMPSPTAAPASPPAPHPDFPPPTTNGSAGADEKAPPLPTPRPRYSPLSPATYASYSSDVLLTSAINGDVLLWDRRVPQPKVAALVASSGTPPWCMSACFSAEGNQVFAGRRNGAVDIWDVRRSGGSGGGLWKTLKGPRESGAVTSLGAFPDGRHLASATSDAIRLWSTSFDDGEDLADGGVGINKSAASPPYKIVAGHPGGVVSAMLIDPLSRFLITASGSSSRGWGLTPASPEPSVVTYHTIESLF